MINAAIVGLGWWGKNIVNAVQGKSDRVRFVRGVSIEPEPVRAFAAQHGLDLSTNLADALRDPNVQMVVLGPGTLRWNSFTTRSVSAPYIPSGLKSLLPVEIGIRKPRSNKAIWIRCTWRPRAPRRSALRPAATALKSAS